MSSDREMTYRTWAILVAAKAVRLCLVSRNGQSVSRVIFEKPAGAILRGRWQDWKSHIR